jgi:hypothetical protein
MGVIPERIRAAETERMMKIQEVILKAMAGKLKSWEAAEIIGVKLFCVQRLRSSSHRLERAEAADISPRFTS